MQNDDETAHERDCVSRLRGSPGWVELAQLFVWTVCLRGHRFSPPHSCLVLSRLQGEVPEHSAPGGGHAQALVSSHPHAARLSTTQQRHLPLWLPPTHSQSRPTAQAQGSAPYPSEGAFVSSDASTPFLLSPAFASIPNHVFLFPEASSQLDGQGLPHAVPRPLQVPSPRLRGQESEGTRL